MFKMMPEITIINVEVGHTPREHVQIMLQNIKTGIEALFRNENKIPPKVLFIPTYNGVGKCTLSGNSEVFRIIDCSCRPIDIKTSDLIKLYVDKITAEVGATET